MPDEISKGNIPQSRRDLIARVATLELLVADLIHALWRLDPDGMERLAGDAAHDAELQHTRLIQSVPEHQRDRLHTVLESRRRTLGRRKTEA